MAVARHATKRLLDRCEFEAGKYRGQLFIFEWLFQHGPVGVTVSQTLTGVAGRVDKRYSARGERFRHWVAIITIQFHIQQGDVEDLRIDQGKRLIDRRGRGHRLASEVGKHVFYHDKNQHFILDNEDLPTRKQIIHRHLLVRECPSCDKSVRTVVQMHRAFQLMGQTTLEATKRLVGAVVVVLNITLLFTPLPLSNVVPALVIALISLAYLEEDGLLLSIALLASVVVLAVELAAVWETVLGAKWIYGLW